MPAICPSLVRAKVMRVTRLDECGEPVIGTCSVVTSDGLISVAAAPQYQDPEEILQRNGNGDLCIYDRGCSNFLRNDLTITFCRVDPDLFGMVTGDPVILDDTTPTPNSVGFRQNGDALCDTKFALEVWSDIPGQQCTPSGGKQYWYHLWPFIGNPTWGEQTIENGAITFTVNASTLDGSTWGVGPHDVINAGVGPVPSPLLTPIGATDHYHGQVTTLAPPASACGCTALAA